MDRREIADEPDVYTTAVVGKSKSHGQNSEKEMYYFSISETGDVSKQCS